MTSVRRSSPQSPTPSSHLDALPGGEKGFTHPGQTRRPPTRYHDGQPHITVDLTDAGGHNGHSREIPSDARFIDERDGLVGAGPIRRAVKRLTDIVVAATMLMGLAPVIVVIALLIRVTTKGPALFRQERVGLAGRTFRILKFRTMYEDAEERRTEVEELNEADGPVFKMKKDPRVTPIGQYLRRWSLDELPQIVNVLNGDMSLVGPRPPLPSEVATYNPWESQRLLARPGLTCIWQVSGRSDVDFKTWVEMDIAYIANWTPALDLELLARTLPAVVKRDGAY